MVKPSATPLPTKRPRRRGFLYLVGFGFAVTMVVGFGVGDRARSMREVGAWTEKQAIQSVSIVQPRRGPDETPLALPGTIRAFNFASLYPRASGYVTIWRRGMGERVKKGEVLAEISAPDLDQQLVEAQARLIQLRAEQQQAQANADLGAAVNRRTVRLVAQGWSSLAQGDTDRFTAASREAAVAVAKANVVAQQAVVGRLKELTSFKQVVAPFDGVVTDRTVEIGDLVTANGTSGRALFRVADIHRVRIYVDVPQAFLGDMQRGLKATLELPGHSGRYAAELVSTANAVGEGTRTAQVELQADNPDGKLWPGSFAEVEFHVPASAGTLLVPATTLLFGRDGAQVAKVGPHDKVVLTPIVIGRNLGKELEVTSGVALGDALIDNPQETIVAGEKVAVAGRKKHGTDTASR